MQRFLKFLFILIVQFDIPKILCQNNAFRSVSSSVDSMEDLLEVERQAVFYLENYIRELQNKIDVMQSGFEMLIKEHTKLPIGIEYLSNALNAFCLIHRLRFDWYDWNVFLSDPLSTDEIQNLLLLSTQLPTELEFAEAVDSVHRLENFYNISAADMVNGILNGKQYEGRLVALDAFAIALNLFKRSLYPAANEWIEEALRIHEENPLNTIFNSNLCAFYAFQAENNLKLGNKVETLLALKKALSLDPYSSKLNLRIHEIEYDQYVHLPMKKSIDNITNTDPFYKVRKYSEGSCREKNDTKISNLSCRLQNKVNDFVKLAPLKVEEISLDPYILKFYDIISDEEIAHLKNVSRKKLEPAKVVKEHESIFINVVRTSKVTPILYNSTVIISKIHERLTDMTGLDLNGSEALQAMNYGIAGHYVYHTDFFDLKLNPKRVMENGDRIATVLIYLNDVIDGGETVFPTIGKVVKPEKGTALFWYNLDDKGEPEHHVGHIACPVIVGSKWIVTKWIHERKQFRSRPCLPRKSNTE